MKQAFGIFLLLLLILSCDKPKKILDVSHIPVEVKVAKYHQDFFKADSISLKEVKAKYPYMFPPQLTDKECLAKINDSLQQVLFQKVEGKYHDTRSLEVQLKDVFQRIKYHYPKFRAPIFITNVGDVDYRTNVMYADSLLLCSLDMYLGDDSEVYVSYPRYLARNFKKEMIVRDIAEVIVNTWYPFDRDRTFLGRMIFEGKKLYMVTQFVPTIAASDLFGVSSEKMDWTIENEEATWLHFLKEDLLYDTNPKLSQRFIDKAPFSKFYLPIDKYSPGGVGKYTGLQIVRAYMEKHPKTSLKDLMKVEAGELLKQAGYKPRKK